MIRKIRNKFINDKNFKFENEEEFVSWYTPFLGSLDLDENEQIINNPREKNPNYRYIKNLLIIFAFRYLT
jgi:hypothetical protein